MKSESKVRFKNTIIYLGISIVAGITGVASRNYPDYIPQFLSQYGGDVMWAFAMFFFLSIFFPGRSALSRTIITLTIALVVEIMQLYHAPWIDAVRNTTIGGLILGFGFHWSDVLCYFTGAVLAAAFETLLLERLRTSI